MSVEPTIALIDEIRRSSRSIVRDLGFMDKRLAGTDLSPSAVHALVEIGLGTATKATELGVLLGLEKSTVSRLLADLQKRGLLVAEVGEPDSRSKILKLTRQGELQRREVEDFARNQVCKALSQMPVRARKTVTAGLSSYAKALRRNTIVTPKIMPLGDRVNIAEGYVPTLLARVTEMHAAFYSEQYGFGVTFERKVAAELAEFLGRVKNPANKVIHAQLDGRIVGAVVIDGEDLAHKVAHLRWFIIDDAIRGHGVGEDLLKRAVQHADDQNFSKTLLWTFKGLDVARHLYEKVGFVLSEEKPGRQWGTEVDEQKFVRKSPL